MTGQDLAHASLVVVTATTNPGRASRYVDSWRAHARHPEALEIIVIENGPPDHDYFGTVPAFRKGVDIALAETDAEVIACLHDDLEICEDGWDDKVRRHFTRVPACGLAGFGGAIGLGSARLYQDPYDPMQLARVGFRSNLTDAEAHGIRSLLTERVACLDGFSQIGRRGFWLGYPTPIAPRIPLHDPTQRPWTVLEDLGVIHHFYDGLLGCLAKRAGWEVWYLPVRAHHAGGQTAVGDAGYSEWAKTKTTEGDHGFWRQAHRIGYDEFRDVLPIRV